MWLNTRTSLLPLTYTLEQAAYRYLEENPLMLFLSLTLFEYGVLARLRSHRA